MEDFVGKLDSLVKAFGAVGSLGLIIAFMMFYFYRKDVLQSKVTEKEDKDRVLAVVERNAAAGEGLSRAVEHLSETTRSSAEAYTKQIEHLVEIAVPSPPKRRRSRP